MTTTSRAPSGTVPGVTWHIRPSVTLADQVAAYQTAEDCTRGRALQQLCRRGYELWRKDRTELDALRALRESLADHGPT